MNNRVNSFFYRMMLFIRSEDVLISSQSQSQQILKLSLTQLIAKAEFMDRIEKAEFKDSREKTELMESVDAIPFTQTSVMSPIPTEQIENAVMPWENIER